MRAGKQGETPCSAWPSSCCCTRDVPRPILSPPLGWNPAVLRSADVLLPAAPGRAVQTGDRLPHGLRSNYGRGNCRRHHRRFPIAPQRAPRRPSTRDRRSSWRRFRSRVWVGGGRRARLETPLATADTMSTPPTHARGLDAAAVDRVEGGWRRVLKPKQRRSTVAA